MGNELTPVESFKKAVRLKEDEIWDARAPWLNMKKEVFFTRALLYVGTNDSLKSIMNTSPGKMSLLQCIVDSCIMGMALGGVYPQATIMPMSGKGILVPDAQSLIAFCQAEPAIIKSIQYGIIYSNQDFIIRNMVGKTLDECMTVGFDFKKYDGDLGEPVAAWGFVVGVDDMPNFQYFPKKTIEKIRGDSKSTAWKTWWEKMGEKSIVRYMLKPYVKRKFVQMNLSGPSAIIGNSVEMTEEQAEDYANSDISSRVAAMMGVEEKPEDGPPVIKDKEEDLFR